MAIELHSNAQRSRYYHLAGPRSHRREAHGAPSSSTLSRDEAAAHYGLAKTLAGRLRRSSAQARRVRFPQPQGEKSMNPELSAARDYVPPPPTKVVEGDFRPRVILPGKNRTIDSV